MVMLVDDFSAYIAELVAQIQAKAVELGFDRFTVRTDSLGWVYSRKGEKFRPDYNHFKVTLFVPAEFLDQSREEFTRIFWKIMDLRNQGKIELNIEGCGDDGRAPDLPGRRHKVGL